jgi:hypothetical protein
MYQALLCVGKLVVCPSELRIESLSRLPCNFMEMMIQKGNTIQPVSDGGGMVDEVELYTKLRGQTLG